MHEMRQLRDASALGLAAEILSLGGEIRLRALGSSMLPSVWPGDILTIEGTSCHVTVPGDIVLVLRDQRPFIHRVEEKRVCNGHLQWITRGDAVPESDPPVATSELLGKVSCIQRNHRIFVPRRQVSTAARLLAWMLCHWHRFRSVCLRLHSFLQSPDRQATEEIR